MIRFNRGQIAFCIVTIIMIIFLILIGPADHFTHGYYCDEINMEEAVNDLGSPISLKDDYEMYFSPRKDHFAGFEIRLTDQLTDNSGILRLTIENGQGKAVDIIKIDLSRVNENTWYRTYISAGLKKGKRYLLRFSVENCDTIPSLMTIDSDYLREETIEGNIVLGYAYEESTFSFQTKVLIFIFIAAIWLYIFSKMDFIDNSKYLSMSALFVFMTAVLSWNYMYNSMNNSNSSFSSFQSDSETLVSGAIAADENGLYSKAGQMKFGLGRYSSVLGDFLNYGVVPLSDNNWSNGYSKSEPTIVVSSNGYTKNVIRDLAAVRFSNNDDFEVTEVSDDGTWITIKLDADRILNAGKYGNIEDMVFIDSLGKEYDVASFSQYQSQYGLQGKIFRRLAIYLNDNTEITTLNLICAVVTAMVFSAIVLLLAVKYNKLMAVVFFLTFWLSPWIVNFARNLYWVEFTWFAPMLVGLFCTWKINDKKCRIVSYLLAFLTIMIKCLCGYEYISTVMMGLIAFLMVDFICAFVMKDYVQSKLLFRTVIIIGSVSLCGFVTAVCIHAQIKGNGNLIEGIKSIYENVVLRRTSGADLNKFSGRILDSLNASVWDVYCRYFKFSTEIVTGITGNFFPILCCLPLAIFADDYRKKRLNVLLISMYIIFFVTTVSWFCLAKAHSYIHTHMNYVLWYFGFVQVCFYTIVNKILEIYQKLKGAVGE